MDSHAVLRNNIERSFVYFTYFFPLVIPYKTIVYYHNQDVNINTKYQSVHISPYLLVFISVCVSSIQFYYIYRFMCPPAQLKYCTVPKPQGYLYCAFITTHISMLHPHSPNSWQPIICSLFLKFCPFKNVK